MWVWSLGFGVWVWGLGFGVWGLGFGTHHDAVANAERLVQLHHLGAQLEGKLQLCERVCVCVRARARV